MTIFKTKVKWWNLVVLAWEIDWSGPKYVWKGIFLYHNILKNYVFYCETHFFGTPLFRTPYSFADFGQKSTFFTKTQPGCDYFGLVCWVKFLPTIRASTLLKTMKPSFQQFWSYDYVKKCIIKIFYKFNKWFVLSIFYRSKIAKFLFVDSFQLFLLKSFFFWHKRMRLNEMRKISEKREKWWMQWVSSSLDQKIYRARKNVSMAIDE